MSRFFVNQKVTSDIVNIVGDDVAHIKRVLRMREGDDITVCDSDGSIFSCVIDEICDEKICARVLDKAESEAEPRIRVTLYQGIPKGDKMDLIIQKCTELGISTIVPVMMERTIVKFGDRKSTEKKLQRWQRIATEAAKQSGRAVVPEIKEPVSFEEALGAMKEQQYRMVPYENQEGFSIREYLRSAKVSVAAQMSEQGQKAKSQVVVDAGQEQGDELIASQIEPLVAEQNQGTDAESVIDPAQESEALSQQNQGTKTEPAQNQGSFGYMIGPEGGFDPKEIEKIDAAGIKRVSLGKRILRTETAGMAVLTAVMYEFGEMEG